MMLRVASLAAATLTVALQPAIGADADVVHDIDRLKAAYLACDRESTERRMTTADAYRCSMVAELLLEHGFGGDFDQLLSWRRSEQQRKKIGVSSL